MEPTGSEGSMPTGRFALSAEQVRVLGCLLEKQRTTPDAYPLSLNALRLACNQSTNRDPVVDYDEATLRDALHRLERRGLVRLASGAGSRAAKYRHRLAETLPLDGAEQAVLCVLMLRGAQTPGELKQRGERMHSFADLAEVHDTLERLIERALVVRLERRPGHKEERYAQLLQEAAETGESEQADAVAVAAQAPSYNGATGNAPDELAHEHRLDAQARALQTLSELSERVERLERELGELRAEVGAEGSVQAR
ncbi:MAG: YceH family protein [Solirubrobacteraceae bacterium]